jgi:hypothetical protein
MIKLAITQLLSIVLNQVNQGVRLVFLGNPIYADPSNYAHNQN